MLISLIMKLIATMMLVMITALPPPEKPASRGGTPAWGQSQCLLRARPSQIDILVRELGTNFADNSEVCHISMGATASGFGIWSPGALGVELHVA